MILGFRFHGSWAKYINMLQRRTCRIGGVTCQIGGLTLTDWGLYPVKLGESFNGECNRLGHGLEHPRGLSERLLQFLAGLL